MTMTRFPSRGALLLAIALMPGVATAQRYGGYTSYHGQPYRGDGMRSGDGYRGGYDRPDYRGVRCDRGGDGTGGAIIGAIAGGLLGSAVTSRHDRTLGALLGGGAGALAGDVVSRSNTPGYCRR